MTVVQRKGILLFGMLIDFKPQVHWCDVREVWGGSKIFRGNKGLMNFSFKGPNNGKISLGKEEEF